MKIKIDSFVYYEIKRLAGLKNPDWRELLNQIRPDDKRTNSQNNAIHLYCGQIATALNETGLTIPEVLKHYKIDIEWTTDNVKEIIWKTAQIRMFKKLSTKDLEKLSGEINQIHDVINRFLSQEFKGEIPFIPFPSKELKAQLEKEGKLSG